MKTLLLPHSVHRIVRQRARFLPYVRLSRPKLKSLDRLAERGTTAIVSSLGTARPNAMAAPRLPSDKLAPFKWPWWWEK
jgi:hypothetical protein